MYSPSARDLTGWPRVDEGGAKTIVDKYAGSDDKIYMTLEEAIVLSREIALRLSNWQPRPDLVVGIANGALLMTRVIADELSCPMTIVTFRRRGSRVKEWLDQVPYATILLSRIYSIPVFRLPLYYALRSLQGLSRQKEQQEHPDVSGKSVALIDDCIETGQSIGAAKSQLAQDGAGTVIVCCLSWSRKVDSFAMHAVEPDIYIGRRVQHYPWSMNSPFRADLERWLAASAETPRA